MNNNRHRANVIVTRDKRQLKSHSILEQRVKTKSLSDRLNRYREGESGEFRIRLA